MSDPAGGVTRRIPGRAAIFCLVWVAGILYSAAVIDRGWGPADEGLLGQTAERLLGGELPHRDFDDLYTGGLTAVHAFAFKLLGVRLIALRAVLLAAVILWIPLCYAVARRFAPPLLAGAVTLLAVAWSIPAYPASMPSWYNLFFATAGLLAMLRYLETQRLRWLVGAGFCAGLSLLVKVTGIFLLGALVLILAYRAVAAAAASGRPARPGTWRGNLGFGTVVAVAAVVSVVLVIGTRRTNGTYLQFVAPILILSMIVAAADRGGTRAAWAMSWKPLAALAAGVMLAVLPLLILYASQRALGDLLNGVFVLPGRRVRFAFRTPSGIAILAAAPLAGLVAAGFLVRRRRTAWIVAAGIAAAGTALVLYGVRQPIYGGVGGDGPVYRRVVDSIATIVPGIVAAFALLLASRAGRGLAPERRAPVFAMVAVTAFAALVGFPYSTDLYFHYVAPLIWLSLLALYSVADRPAEPRIGIGVLLFYLAFAVVRVRVRADTRLDLNRGGIWVPAQDNADARAFVSLLRAHSRGGYTFATPDCPEAYFLTGLKNPTRTMYEFFGSRAGRTERTLELLDQHRITAVAINHWGAFSGFLDQQLLAALRARYPDSAVVWHFTVRWSSSHGAAALPTRSPEEPHATLGRRPGP